MTNLKTLKDLKSRDVVLGKPYEWTIRESELKAEAIKWVKAGDKSSLTDWRRVFRSFHNITEEDLK